MNKSFLVLQILLLFFFSIPTNGQKGDEKDKGKAFYTTEEVRRMCGIPVDIKRMN